MSANPMQKKSRNAFLLGMLLMLIIATIAMVVMFIVLRNNNKKQEEEAAAQTYVYRLNTSVKSGEEITSDKVTSVLVNAEAVPSDAISSKTKKTENEKETWIDRPFTYSGYRSKINLEAGTIICENMLYEEELPSTARIQEYNMLQLPVQLDPGEYVDIRFLVSNGQDYIVVSHKEVVDATATTIWLQLTEEEILLMSNAMVESYITPSSTLYVSRYVEPGTQDASSITYIPSAEVISLINKDSNIINQAKIDLINRYNDPENQAIRNNLQNELNRYEEEDKLGNIEAQMLESRDKAREEREEFLNGVQ